MNKNDSEGGAFLLGFLVGGIVGAAIGIILAPKSGSDIRHDIYERSEAWRTRAEEMAANVRQRVEPAVDTAKDKITPVVGQVTSRVSRAQRRSDDEDSSQA